MAKFIDNSIIVETAWVMTLRDQRLSKKNKMNFDLKAHLKKTKTAKQK